MVLAPTGDGNVRSFLGESQRSGSPDSRATTGYKSNFTFHRGPDSFLSGAELLSALISYIGYPAIINAQITLEIRALSIIAAAVIIQYRWSRIFKIPAGVALRRIN